MVLNLYGVVVMVQNGDPFLTPSWVRSKAGGLIATDLWAGESLLLDSGYFLGDY